MHIATVFYMDTIRNSFGRPERMWGRVVANHSFLEALAQSPDCDCLTLFVPTRKDVELIGQTLLPSLGTTAQAVSFTDIEDYLRRNPVDVLHAMDPDMWIGAHIRRHLAGRRFALTGMTHSLANDHTAAWALRNNANDVRPEDCLVCTTPTAQRVVESLFARLRQCQPGFVAPATTVIPLGVATESYARPPRTDRAAHGLRDDEFVLLSLARFNPEFKLDLLPVLNLAALVREKTARPFRLLLSGAADDGRYAALIREQVAAGGLQDIVTIVTDPDDRDQDRPAQARRCVPVTQRQSPGDVRAHDRGSHGQRAAHRRERLGRLQVARGRRGQRLPGAFEDAGRGPRLASRAGVPARRAGAPVLRAGHRDRPGCRGRGDRADWRRTRHSRAGRAGRASSVRAGFPGRQSSPGTSNSGPA